MTSSFFLLTPVEFAGRFGGAGFSFGVGFFAGFGGVGLKNIRERLQSYYGKNAGLKIENDFTNGTHAEIELPVKAETV